MSRVSPYLATLRRIPAPIRLAMATREFTMESGDLCLVGWAIRESLAYANGKTAEEHQVREAMVPIPCQCGEPGCTWAIPESYPAISARLFGGSREEWEDIYTGVTQKGKLPAIEREFVTAVLEAVDEVEDPTLAEVA